MVKFALIIALAVIAAFVIHADAHGRFIKPPNRSSIWRFPEFAGQNPPANYNDHELCCGYEQQADAPGSNCGVCGDGIDQSTPRQNEHGGFYGKGIVTGRYIAGQIIDVEVDITAAHLGYMEWRLCTDRTTENQDCFNQHVLQLASGSGTRLLVDHGTGLYSTRLKLPDGVTCSACVIQWNYRAGNSWGQCDDGSYAYGCGQQETYRGCSDVVIE